MEHTSQRMIHPQYTMVCHSFQEMFYKSSQESCKNHEKDQPQNRPLVQN